MSRILITVANGVVANVAADDPHAVIFVRDNDMQQGSGLFAKAATQLDTTFLRPEEMDVLLLVGELEET